MHPSTERILEACRSQPKICKNDFGLYRSGGYYTPSPTRGCCPLSALMFAVMGPVREDLPFESIMMDVAGMESMTDFWAFIDGFDDGYEREVETTHEWALIGREVRAALEAEGRL